MVLRGEHVEAGSVYATPSWFYNRKGEAFGADAFDVPRERFLAAWNAMRRILAASDERIEPLPDGSALRIRPIRPEDATLEIDFVERMSERSRYLRFFSAARGLTPQMLARFTQVDYDRELALIALPEPDPGRILGVARYNTNPDGDSCEFAIAIADDWSGRGLGKVLMNALMSAARDAGYRSMTGSVLRENDGMLRLASRLNFELRPDPEDPAIVKVARALD